MKKNYLIILAAFLLLLGVNAYFFKSFYNLQVSHQKNLLLQQTEVCSFEIERVVQKFESDLNYILFSDDIAGIFAQENSDGLRKLQLFYSTYTNLVKNIDIYDNNKNVLNLFRDSKKNFITDSYIAQRQRDLSLKEDVIMQNSEYQYVLPVFKDKQIFANILVTINLKDYLLSELEKFHLEGYTWQWVIDMDNKQIYNTDNVNYPVFENSGKLMENLGKELEGLIIHKVGNDTINMKLLTVYAPIKVLDKKFGIAMSVDQRASVNQIFSKLTVIAIISIFVFLIVSFYFIYQISLLKKKIRA
jgi:hypothetical protein